MKRIEKSGCVLALFLFLAGGSSAAAQEELFSDGFESGDTSAWGQAAQLRLRSLIDDASPAPGPVEVTTPAEEPRYVPGKPAAPPPAEPKPQNQNHWGWGAAVGALLAAVLALLGIKGVKAWRA